MKREGLVLGLVGGILAVLFTVMMIVTGAAKLVVKTTTGVIGELSETITGITETFEDIDEFGDLRKLSETGLKEKDPKWDEMKAKTTSLITGLLICIPLSFLLGILGIIGGSICKKKKRAGGILMLIAGVGILICSIIEIGRAHV